MAKFFFALLKRSLSTIINLGPNSAATLLFGNSVVGQGKLRKSHKGSLLARQFKIMMMTEKEILTSHPQQTNQDILDHWLLASALGLHNDSNKPSPHFSQSHL